MVTKTQMLKETIRSLGKRGESFSHVRLGVGQEFVSIIRMAGQESSSEILNKITPEERRLPTERQTRKNGSEV